MPVEEIIKEIKKQDEIIDQAQQKKKELYNKLDRAGLEDYDWITVQKAARISSISASTLYYKINRGELQTKYIGSSVRIRESEVLTINDRG